MSASASAWTSVPVPVKIPEVVSERVVLEVVKCGIPATVMASATAFLDVGVMDWDFEQSMINYLSMLMVLWLSKTIQFRWYKRPTWGGSVSNIVEFFIKRCRQGFAYSAEPKLGDAGLPMSFLPTILLDYLLRNEETSTQLYKRLEETLRTNDDVLYFIHLLSDDKSWSVYRYDLFETKYEQMPYECEEREIVDEESLRSFLFTFDQKVKGKFPRLIDEFLKLVKTGVVSSFYTHLWCYGAGDYERMNLVSSSDDEVATTWYVELFGELLGQNDYGNLIYLHNVMGELQKSMCGKAEDAYMTGTFGHCQRGP